MWYLDVLRWTLFICDLVLIPLYITVMFTLIACRNHAKLGQPFFKLCVSIGIADIGS